MANTINTAQAVNIGGGLMMIGTLFDDTTDPAWNAHGSNSFAIVFPQTMDHVPVVSYGIWHIDTSHDENTRVDVSVDAVTVSGFEMVINTFNSNSTTFGLGVNWIAV